MTTTLTTAANLKGFIKGTVTDVEEAITLTRLSEFGGVGVQISGTWAGTITFEATLDGANWVAFVMLPSTSLDATTDAVSSTTANGAWSAPNMAYQAVRARYSTDTSGTPTIAIRSLPGATK